MLSSADHQIVYGRRGTRKTHALWYLADEVQKRGDLAVFIDMRTIGSTGGVYADPNVPIRERGTRLLLDTIKVIPGRLRDPCAGDARRRRGLHPSTSSRGRTGGRDRCERKGRRDDGDGGCEDDLVDRVVGITDRP